MSTISDQKKRTLEALQQRYAAAKAKKLQDKPRCQTRNKDSAPKPNLDASRKGKAPDFIPSRTSAPFPSKKGLAISSSSASSGGETNPVYSELSFAPHDNLLQRSISDLDSMDVVHNVVYDIIQKGGDAGKITKGAKKLKLEKGILLDNYVHRGPRLVDAQAKSLLIHSKRSKRHMSLKQHKKCGSFDLPETLRKFDLYKPMHEMWKEYITELTKSTLKKQLSETLLSADLHGALVIVAECKSASSYQGVCGIMIRDTAETFGIISDDNRFRVVPKAGSVFILQADCWKVTLIGDKLSPREKLKENQRQQRVQAQIR
uniref:Ribonuclease P protein subunit p29 n=1 Tax=Oryza nivara TaxID=4536 RepID=A0A0E0HFW3_ORYNI